jgi:hypothetical protein
MAPYSTTKLTMTVSQILLSNKPDGTCCQAKTDWTIANNGGTKRPCQVLTPGNAAPVSTGTIPTGFTASPSLVVADVTYQYIPGSASRSGIGRSRRPSTWRRRNICFRAARVL